MNQHTEINSCDMARQTLAVASVPMQNADFSEVFPIGEALCKGTIFPALYLPFLGVKQ